MIGRPAGKRTETSTVDKERSKMKASMTHRNLPRFLGALAVAGALLLGVLGAQRQRPPRSRLRISTAYQPGERGCGDPGGHAPLYEASTESTGKKKAF